MGVIYTTFSTSGQGFEWYADKKTRRSNRKYKIKQKQMKIKQIMKNKYILN